MTRVERWLLWVSTALVGATGVAYFWAKYLVTPTDPFAVVNHPLQPLFLKLHVLTAPLLVFAVGAIAVRHVWRHFRAGVRRARRTGLVTAAALAPMVLTGYLIQVLTGESLLTAMAWSHIGFGTLYLVGAGLHGLVLRRGGRAPREGRAAADPTTPAAEPTTPAADGPTDAPESPGREPARTLA